MTRPRIIRCQLLPEAPALAQYELLQPVEYPHLGDSRERWLEEALANHPDLLLLDRIDPHAATPVLVGRQLEIPGRGPLDLLFLDSTAVLTLVETKLAENRELRREVVAQVFDYASFLTDSRYDTLEGLFCSADQPLGEGGSLTAKVWQASGRGEPEGSVYDKWASHFKGHFEENLRARRLRLVIVADRIEARLRDLVEFMVGGARPDFQIALVEVTPYKVAGDTRAFLVPSLHWSRTPSFPPLEFGGKVKWTPKLFQEAIRRNNGDDEVALQMIDEIFSWMQSRAETLAPNAWLDWPTSSSDRPCVNLRIRSLSNALPHLEAVPGGGGWISCRDVMRKHREPLTRFLERIRTLEPYGQLADELLIGRKNDFKMSRDYLGDPEVRSKVLSALEELQDAIIESP